MDPFVTLGIERTFDIDLVAVEKTHRELSRALHPDRHVTGVPTERRVALSKAIEVNEAWRIVKDPIRRAEALFRLAGIAVGETHEPKPLPDLLMDMMEQRELLDDAKIARDATAVRGLAARIEARAGDAERALAAGFRGNTDDRAALERLVPLLGELRFYRRFLDEVSEVEDQFPANASPATPPLSPGRGEGPGVRARE